MKLGEPAERNSTMSEIAKKAMPDGRTLRILRFVSPALPLQNLRGRGGFA